MRGAKFGFRYKADFTLSVIRWRYQLVTGLLSNPFQEIFETQLRS
jgi:hypothetical protein